MMARRFPPYFRLLLPALLAALAACRGDQGGGGELHARQVVVEREVEGLRAAVARLERGEPILPEEAVVVAVSEEVVREFLGAQLPFELEVERYRVSLRQAEAKFTGTPGVRLIGTIVPLDHPDLVGEVRLIGALESIRIDAGSGLLQAKVAVDHVDLLRVGGLESLLSAAAVDELARRVRQKLADRIPAVQIPVKLEQSIRLPDVEEGPVRIRGATMPLAVSVADVFAGRGVLWVAVNVVPGELVREAR